MAVRRRNRALRRARRRELDWLVIKEIGWRGFRWEEGSAGEGLPSGFRGSRGGQLTQGGIKAIMTKVSRETIRLDKADFGYSSPPHPSTDTRIFTPISATRQCLSARFSSKRSDSATISNLEMSRYPRC